MNKRRFFRQIVSLSFAFGVGLMLMSCATQRPALTASPIHTATFYPIRFLLTFDDGPSIRSDFNPTKSILDDLANNPVQPGIKAIFFVQTRAHNGGGTDEGREIMQRELREGHLLGFHTATKRHVNHRYLTPAAFKQSLQDGIDDYTSITGRAPTLVRPPFWSYDHRTFSAYQAHGMQMLLTHLSANDGKIYGVNSSPRRRSNLHNQLTQIAEKIRAGSMPIVNGEIPVIVTFHDINPYTARHMKEYLQILMELAKELELPVAGKPFYDNQIDLESAALANKVLHVAEDEKQASIWSWLWN